MSEDKLKALKGYREALKAIEYHTSPRAQRLGLLESYVEGTQYEGRPNWFNDKVEFFKKAPCIVYPIVRIAISSFVDLVLGDTRFVGFNFEPEEGVLSLDEAESITSSVVTVQRASRFKTAARHALYNAMACGSACMVLGVRNGKLFAEEAPARWCEPELDQNNQVLSLAIQYPFLEEYQDERTGEWLVKAKLFRREINATEDITFKSVDAEVGKKPVWSRDKSKTFQHNLGFCPVVWYPHMRGARVTYGKDGMAIHEGLEDELYALDCALSQRHRAALYCGDPQWTEIGVERGYNPNKRASTDRVWSTATGGMLGVEGAPEVTGEWVERKIEQGERAKGPGNVWQYENPEVQVKLHTLGENSLGAINQNAQDLRAKLSEALSVVFIDPEQVKFASQITGKALETLRERQINRCDQIRDDVADGLLQPCLSILLRLVAEVPGIIIGKEVIDALPLLQKFLSKAPGKQDDTAAAPTINEWALPEPQLVWGPYFNEDPAEQRVIADQVRMDLAAGVITRRTAVERLKPFYKTIGNVDAYLEALKVSRQEELDEKLDEAKQMVTITGKPTQPGAGGAQQPKPKPVQPALRRS